jgi:hypothetical protein
MGNPTLTTDWRDKGFDIRQSRLKVKKIARPFGSLEISATKEYGQGAQMSDGSFEQKSAAKRQASKSKKSKRKSRG